VFRDFDHLDLRFSEKSCSAFVYLLRAMGLDIVSSNLFVLDSDIMSEAFTQLAKIASTFKIHISFSMLTVFLWVVCNWPVF